jgi:uncharacterized membrane protein
MKLFPEKDYRELFRIGILVKAVDGIIEACAGVFFYFAGYTTINHILFSVFHEEIAEGPRDPFWQFFINEWHSISLSSNSFWGLLFFAHGLIKVALSVALLKNYLWAYPTAAAVFTVFVGYEIYSLASHPSLFLLCITIFDAFVIGLILHEYRHIKKRRDL